MTRSQSVSISALSLMGKRRHCQLTRTTTMNLTVISQRRRWNNGAFFAALHASTHYYRLLTSGQSFLRKIWMSIIFLYNVVQLFFSFVGLSSFYLAFFFLCNAATADPSTDPFGGHGQDVISISNNVFICTIGVTIVCALGNKPSGSRWWYMSVIVVFAALFIIAVSPPLSLLPSPPQLVR